MNRREALTAFLGLPVTARITRAAVKPRDVIVIETDMWLSESAKRNILTQCKALWPDNRIAICDGGMRFRVVEQA